MVQAFLDKGDGPTNSELTASHLKGMRQPMSELGLYLGCVEDPGAFQGWFPRHHVKTPLTKPDADNAERVEEFMARKRCYAGGVLRSYQEPILAQGTVSETYRLIRSPSSN